MWRNQLSEEIKREFIIKDTDALLFYGANDRNLKIIEKNFHVLLLGRGDNARGYIEQPLKRM